MSRSNRSLRLFPVLGLLGLVTAFGCHAGQTTSSKTKSSSSSGSKRSSSSTVSTGVSSGRDSNEGHLLLGNPTNAGKDPNNYLLEKPQYAMSFNHANGEPNWVSWHTDSSNLGDTKRGKFHADSDLPSDWQITPADYKGSGYDRGHVCPSGDRTSSRKDNDATFCMSNMMPQAAQLNQHIWADVEDYLRDQIKAGNEVYEIAGPTIPADDTERIADGKVVVPTSCWKVALILPEGTGDLKRINANTRILAIGMPNKKDERVAKGDWHNYITTLSKVESVSKLTLFPALSPSVKKALLDVKDAGN